MTDKDIKKELDLYKDFLKDQGLESPGAYYLTNLRLIASNTENEYWNMDRILLLWKEYLKKGNPVENLDLYIHIPYCYRKCHYCCYAGKEPEGNEELENYIDKLIEYFHFFSPVFKGIKFNNLHIGGGTPSILSESLMERMFSELFSSFQIDSEGQKSFEVNPSSSSREKMKILKKYDFNKVSIGVQSFNEKTLELNNRGDQTMETVNRAVSDALDVGIDWVNVDLLAGMYGDSDDNVIDSFRKAVELGSHSIYFYSIRPTEYYLEKMYSIDNEEYFLKIKKTMELIINKISDIAKEANYRVIGSGAVSQLGYQNTWIFLRKDIKPVKFYCFGADQENSVFGIGPESISYIKKSDRYKAISQLKEDPFDCDFLVTPYDKNEKMLLYIFNGLSLTKSISRKKFEEIFDEDILFNFRNPIEKLEKIGGVSITDDKIIFNSDDPADRLLYALFFLGEKGITSFKNNKALIKRNTKKRCIIEKEKDIVFEDNEEVDIKRSGDKIQIMISEGKAYFIRGCFIEKEENHLLIFTGEGESKFRFSDETKFVEVKTQEDGSLLFVRDIKVDNLISNDELLVLVYNSKKTTECLLVRKMI